MSIDHKEFFARYKKIIALVYGSFLISTLFLFSFLYHDNHAALVKDVNLRLHEQKNAFNSILRVRYDAVKSLQRQARQFLNRPNETIHNRNQFSNINNQTFYKLDLQKDELEQYPSIVGQGRIESVALDTWQELMMIEKLAPLMVVLKNSLKTLVSFEYVSKKGIYARYPYDLKTAHRFPKDLENREFVRRSQPQNNREDKLFWTDVFMDLSGQGRGLLITCAAPVYRGPIYKGVISGTYQLGSINFFVENIHQDFGNLYIVNEMGTVVGEIRKEKKQACKICKLDEQLPPGLSSESIKNIPENTLTKMGSYWVYVGDIAYAPWKLIYICPSTDLVYETLRNILPGFLLAIVFTVLFLFMADRLISREFIRPAKLLVNHINHRGQDYKAQLMVPDPWQVWFQAVSEVFAENQKLVDNLENHILKLDETVARRTKDVSKKNTQLEKALVDLKKAQSQIVTQEKLAGLGALTAGIAHEIRNPLNFVMNFAESSKLLCADILKLIEDLPRQLPEAHRGELDELCGHLQMNMTKIYDHGNRADLIVRSMLTHARGGEDKPSRVDLNDLVQENLLLALASFKQKGFTPMVQKQLGINLPPVFVYPQDLGRVFLNLFNNSLYALQDKYAKGEGGSAEITVQTFLQGDEVVCVVKDNGSGIPKSVGRKIFDPFFTTKPAGDGTGLGLSLSYDIVVNQHHGKLTMQSEVGQYTEFTITIPQEVPLEKTA